MTTYYKVIKCSQELPTKKGWYFVITKIGQSHICDWNGGYWNTKNVQVADIVSWLQPIEHIEPNIERKDYGKMLDWEKIKNSHFHWYTRASNTALADEHFNWFKEFICNKLNNWPPKTELKDKAFWDWAERGFIVYTKQQREAFTESIFGMFHQEITKEQRVKIENLLIAYDQMVDKLSTNF